MKKETHITIYKLGFGLALGWAILDLIRSWLWSDFFLWLHQHPNTITVITIMLLLPLAIHARYNHLQESKESEPESTHLQKVDDTIKGE